MRRYKRNFISVGINLERSTRKMTYCLFSMIAISEAEISGKLKRGNKEREEMAKQKFTANASITLVILIEPKELTRVSNFEFF